MEKIRLVAADSDEIEEFFVLEQVKLGGKMYLLVTDQEEGDGMCLILRDDAEEGSEESLYAVVEDDNELSAVLLLFSDKLEEMILADVLIPLTPHVVPTMKPGAYYITSGILEGRCWGRSGSSWMR